MATTAKRSDMRLLAVVLGEETAAIRNQETSELLDYGFNNYQLKILKSKEDVIDTVKLSKANQDSISVVPKENVSILLKKNEIIEEYQYEKKINELTLPLKVNDTVGKLLVKNKAGELIKEVDLTVKENVSKISFIKLWLNFFKSAVSGS